MGWFSIVVLVLILGGVAWVWGSLHDPKHGGTIGCCGCGQCLASGECVMVKKMKEKSEKKPPAA